MKLSAAFSLLYDLWIALRMGLPPTLVAILHSPLSLFKPTVLSRLLMANIWDHGFGQSVDEAGKPIKEDLIPGNASGIVLDIGAGHGHTMTYLDRSKVAKYIALEPNTNMHPHIRELGSSLGYDEVSGSLLILSCGAEDAALVLPSHSVDTLISILTLCSVPNPQSTISSLVTEVLKPGGTFLFFEHVLSPRADVAWWQWFWSPVWSKGFDGCRLDRPTHLMVDGLGESVWAEKNIWGREGEEESLFYHRIGKYVKAY